MVKTILGIETSCDETSVAILRQENDRIQILSNIIGTSAQLQEKFGGVIPEQAAREQLASMIPVLSEALSEAQVKPEDLDAIAITQGPGLIGSLLVGVETAKVLAKTWQKPLIPINHLIGHFYANWISQETPSFPCIGLLVSGGHTDLVLFKDHGKFEYLGGTRDDASGECFDKCARLIGYPYPGGPKISKIATKGNVAAFDLPRPMLDSKDFDFSFSGLKTAFASLVNKNFEVSNINPENAEAHWKHIVLDKSLKKEEQKLADLCASVEQAIIDVLVSKTIDAVKCHKVTEVIVAGGVAANQKLTQELGTRLEELGQDIKLHVPPAKLCTDNAAMIASAAFFSKEEIKPEDLQANPNLSLAY